jgi:signal transduction histidine kinase
MIAKGDQVAARSRSLWTDEIAIAGLASGRSHVLTGPNGERLRAFVRAFNLGRQSQSLSVTVAAPAELAENEVRTVVGSLIALLGIVGIGSVVAVALLLNQGLAPLKDVANAVVQISRGEIQSIKPTGYREIDPLVGAVNGLIANVREVLAKSRLHTSNLAHAIKTPLALISARVHSAMPHDPSINENVDLISRHIQHHLKRARFAPTEPIISTSISVKPVIEDILLVIQRTFHNRSVNVEMRTADDVAFLGEREDLEELIGNLVENAYKWAQQRILIEANNTTAGQLVVTVCDDGVGIDDAAREVVLRPGVRLDETVSGYGLGLSIAAELIERYRGQLSLDRSTLGGLKVSVYLPGILTRS